MAATLEDIRRLRENTNAGVMDCKTALAEAGGDIDKAVQVLRKKGIELASKKASRAAREGLVGSYVHLGGKIAVLVEVNCETDFVARNEEFRNFVKDVAMQVAASNPLCVRREDVAEDVLEKEKEIFKSQIKNKPENIVEKIISGKLEKFYKESCLLEQPFVKNPDISIKDYLNSVIAGIGENIVVKRFVRYQLGEEG